MAYVKITKEEESAIRSLKRLAKKWPKSLSLFSWSGSLVVTKEGSEQKDVLVDDVQGIPNDGGDPDSEIDQNADVQWP